MAENFFGITDKGRVRDNNEDTFIAEAVQAGNLVAACVIDGVGGYEGGEIAARIARECIQEHLQNLSGDLTEAMSRAIIHSNEKIYNENRQREQQEPMACVLTMALADVNNNQFHYAHVGDTRLYLLRDNTLVKVTKDHSFVGFLEDSGRLSEEDAMRHPKRNEINKALGFDPQIQLYNDYVETGSSPFLPGDMLLLCSDGLTDMVNSYVITSILTDKVPLKEKCQQLIDAANEAGGKDNVTAVLVQNDKKPLKVKAAKPAKIKKGKRGAANETAEHLPAVSDDAQIAPSRSPRRGGGNKGLVALLSVVCVVLLAALIWQLMKSDRKPEEKPIAVYKNRNAQETKLQDSLNMTSAKELSLADSIYGHAITISDTLLIENDSLHLKGNGIILRADPDYHGPGLMVSPNSRSVMLENIVLENFDIGLLTQSKAVYFMNVQFRNCRIPMQYQHSSSGNSYISGAVLNDSTFQIE
jgi:PPM family protein phosphatase